jgi:cellulose synthase/poly-beta-1,6-N-acetylglucosamine synthase-like glycosyltransferase
MPTHLKTRVASQRQNNTFVQSLIRTGYLVVKHANGVLEFWGEWCICEDSELGLRLYRAGYDSVYVKDSFGRGVTPDTLSGYMTQRHRWVYGAMQILKRHWRGTANTCMVQPDSAHHFKTK